jgi:hypothetical protein
MTPARETDFDDWITETFGAVGPFTMLVVLLDLDNGVQPLRSAHLHVMGDELRWPELTALFASAGVGWTGAVLYRAGREGLVQEQEARRRQIELLQALQGDRSLIREGEFFNQHGLRLSLEEDAPPRLS